MQSIESEYYKSVGANVEGRDFVIGDLHGCYDELMKLLDYVSFNEEKDRLFVTGDIIDRGPKVMECLSLLEKKWFYSILGNHEDLAFGKFRIIKDNNTKDIPKKELEYYKKLMPHENLLKSLPLVYEIDHVIHKKIFIVHSEILPEHISNISEIEEVKYNVFLNSMKSLNLNKQMTTFFKELSDKKFSFGKKQKLLWSRKLIIKFFNENKENLENKDFSFLNAHKNNLEGMKIFCGHNIVPFPMKINQQYYLDTGAALGYADKELNTSIFSSFGHSLFVLSMVDISTGMCFGCVSSPKNRGDILKLELSIYD